MNTITKFSLTDYVPAPCLPEFVASIVDAEDVLDFDRVMGLKEIEIDLTHQDKHMADDFWVTVTLPVTVKMVKGTAYDTSPVGSLDPNDVVERPVMYPKVCLQTALVTVGYVEGLTGLRDGQVIKLTEAQLSRIEDLLEDHALEMDWDQLQYEKDCKKGADDWDEGRFEAIRWGLRV